MTTPLAIGIDLGGTNLKGLLMTDQGEILSKKSVPTKTSRGPGAVIDDMACLVEQLISDSDAGRSGLVGVGVGAPGPLSHSTGRIIKAANLPGWIDVPVRDLLNERVGVPVVLENDGNAAAYGEFWTGRSEHDDDLVVLTLGTGVGAGVILNGHVLHGHFENAAELGHSIVALDGLACPCGQRGCLEQYASAAGVARRVRNAVKAGEASLLGERIAAGQEIDAADVAGAARAGDPTSLRVWTEACDYLAIACINIQHAFNPARVYLGGGMAEAGAFLLERVRGTIATRRWRLHEDIPSVSLARLGYDAGAVGAAALMFPPALK